MKKEETKPVTVGCDTYCVYQYVPKVNDLANGLTLFP